MVCPCKSNSSKFKGPKRIGHFQVFPDCGCGCEGKEQEKKMLISALAGLLFYVIANPETFKLTRSIFGAWVSDGMGYPSINGLALHTFVFFLVTWLLMNVRK
tara:strand:+ start:71 stop:376 length:306 start_codon:yes stop_codon:yes gene_type:complete